MVSLNSILKRDLVISLEEGIKLLGNDKAIYRLVEEGKLVHIYPKGLGYFSHPDLEEGTAHFAIVKKFYPHCVVSGKTALALYGLGLDYISKIDVDISRKTNLVNELFNVHRVVDSKINNVIEKSFEEQGIKFKIKIYSAERCLFEAYKYFRGLDSYFYALKIYRKKYLNSKNPGEQFNSILQINKKIGREIINLLMMDGES